MRQRRGEFSVDWVRVRGCPLLQRSGKAYVSAYPPVDLLRLLEMVATA